MSAYKVKVTLDNSDEGLFTVSESTIDLEVMPSKLEKQQCTFINQILTRWVRDLEEANISKVEIEKE